MTQDPSGNRRPLAGAAEKNPTKLTQYRHILGSIYHHDNSASQTYSKSWPWQIVTCSPVHWNSCHLSLCQVLASLFTSLAADKQGLARMELCQGDWTRALDSQQSHTQFHLPNALNSPYSTVCSSDKLLTPHGEITIIKQVTNTTRTRASHEAMVYIRVIRNPHLKT